MKGYIQSTGTALIVVLFIAFASACQDLTDSKTPVVVQIKSQAVGSGGASLRSVAPGTTVDVISAYNVVFQKIEIGNSEADKFTLWESVAGETKDIASLVSFTNVQPVTPGTYNYVRLTIGTTLSVAGSVVDTSVTPSETHTGTGTATLTDTQYLWGTNISTASGELTIQSPITISADSTLTFQFAIAGTVTYQGGTSPNAVLSVVKPVLTLQ